MKHLVLVALLSACTPAEETFTNIANEPGGNPLVPELPLYPYPQDMYLVEDASTATGRRLALSEEAMPFEVDASLFAADDGFSRITPILTWFPKGVDPDSIPGDTTDLASPVLLINAETLQPHPALVERDGLAMAGQQALIIRPLSALAADATYVVILRNGLAAEDGSELRTTRAFAALRDGVATDSDAVEGMREDFEVVNTTIAALDFDPESVVLAWQFSTRSESQVVNPALSMHDQMWAEQYGDAVIDSVNERTDGITTFQGHIDVPDFIGSDLVIKLDADGNPERYGNRTMSFLVTVPSAITEPRPVIAYGHGFFSNKEETTRSLKPGLLQWNMAAVAIDFHGFNSEEEFDVLLKFGGPMAGLQGVVNQQIQSQAEFTALAALIEQQLPDLIVLSSGVKPIDPNRMSYMGISNGGTQGLSIAAASPAYERAVLVVPGGGWSHMLQRAVQWNTMGLLFGERYPDARDLQLYMSLLQNRMDPADSINFVEHLGANRFDGRLPMRAVLHEAVNDCQVTNVVTHMVARTAQAPMVVPAPIDVPYLDTVSAPASGAAGNVAMFVYDEGFEDNPIDNVPPSLDNSTHGTVRKLDSYLEQVGLFLENGDIVQVCDGPCDPN